MAEFDSANFLKSMSSSPGVYQMMDANGEIIYVGKARNLKNRLQSYFQKTNKPIKTAAMVAQIADIKVTITHSDAEALLLEHTLIKKHLPKYNVLLRDDKSYPYILIAIEQDYPRISLYRGSKKKQGKFYGPYPSGLAARETLNFLQRAFKLRPCRDSYFKNRSRPCLQYQLNRCSAPCVGYISKEDYQKDLRHAKMFLEGKNQKLIDELGQMMDKASVNLDYEYAAFLRDKITYLQQVQATQSVVTDKNNADIICLLRQHSITLIQMIFIRGGELVGNKSFFPALPLELSEDDVFYAFISQYYLQLPAEASWPQEIIVSEDFSERSLLAKSLSEIAKKKITIIANPRTNKKRWLDLAKQNAAYALDKYLSDKGANQKRLEMLTNALKLPAQPHRIECFDISHSQGEATVASCVVFDKVGMLKRDYRYYNIKDIKPGDDYAAMKQALFRRYQKHVEHAVKLPEIVLIDGGKGQLSVAEEVFNALGLSDITLLAISKGPSRKAGLETLHLAKNNGIIILSPDSPALHLLQQIRDEAHRFAITGHRQQRGKKRKVSVLEGVPGIGAAKRRALIKRFGGIQSIKNASIDELAKTPGIGKALAKLIFDAFHE